MAVVCLVYYLAGHHRPTHEVLFSKDKSFEHAFNRNFAGMTREPVEFATLVEARTMLRDELRRRLTDRHKSFLIGYRAPNRTGAY